MLILEHIHYLSNSNFHHQISTTLFKIAHKQHQFLHLLRVVSLGLHTTLNTILKFLKIDQKEKFLPAAHYDDIQHQPASINCLPNCTFMALFSRFLVQSHISHLLQTTSCQQNFNCQSTPSERIIILRFNVVLFSLPLSVCKLHINFNFFAS